MINKVLVFALLFLGGLYAPKASAQEAAQGLQPLYSPTTPEYIARAYWAIGKLSVERDADIDRYLMVAECTLFQQFYNDDVEWSKIREATKKYITANRHLFSTRFEIIQPILLDRYDEIAKGFKFMPSFQMIGVKRIQISDNNIRLHPCLNGGNFSENEFPINAVINLSHPLDFTFVKVEKPQLDEYLRYLQEKKINVNKGRPAYIRYRFKVDQIMKPVSLGTKTFASFYGSLESVSIFGDRELFIKFVERDNQ